MEITEIIPYGEITEITSSESTRKFEVGVKILGSGENFWLGQKFWVGAKILGSGENFRQFSKSACWHVGMLACWHLHPGVTVAHKQFSKSACWHEGMLACRHVGMLACRQVGMLAFASRGHQ